MRVPRLFLLMGLFLTLCPAEILAGSADSEDLPRRRVGLTLGSPQTLALGYEYAVASPVQLQANAGTVLLVSALSARVLLVPDRWRVQPYGFVGGGLVHSVGLENSEEEGWTGFTWIGGGLRVRIAWLLLFGELGGLSNLNESKGYDPHYTAAAVGFLVEY